MIGLFHLYAWFRSTGLFYAVSLDFEGQVVLRSFRRRLEVSARQVRTIEGSRLSGGCGFVRFKLFREGGYLFCHGRNRELEEVLLGIRKLNPR